MESQIPVYRKVIFGDRNYWISTATALIFSENNSETILYADTLEDWHYFMGLDSKSIVEVSYIEDNLRIGEKMSLNKLLETCGAILPVPTLKTDLDQVHFCGSEDEANIKFSSKHPLGPSGMMKEIAEYLGDA